MRHGASLNVQDPFEGAGAAHADSDFKLALKMIIFHIEVKYSEPEEKILLQNSECNGSMYVVLNGVFDVQTLLFNRGAKSKAEEDAKEE